MATNHARVRVFPSPFNSKTVSDNLFQLQQRRTLAQRAKVDENAMSRHSRLPASSGTTGPIRFTTKENALKTTAMTRQVLSEVTMTAVNRKVCQLSTFLVAVAPISSIHS